MLLGLCKLLKGIEDCIRLYLTFCLTTGIYVYFYRGGRNGLKIK